MRAMHIKLTVAGVVLLAGVTYLAIAGAKSGWVYHLPVDQFVTNAQYRTQRVRLCGTVDADGLVSTPATLTAAFNLKGDKQHIAIEYHGVIPEMFQADREVVVEGRLGDDGVFHADVLMTKCASKYEDDRMHKNATAKNPQLTAGGVGSAS
jgi:cytochrome c-type biogenesis protein CcmE